MSLHVCAFRWSWIRPYTPRQHDVPESVSGPQVGWPQPGWSLRSAPCQQLSSWVPPRASTCLVPWQTLIICSEERIHGRRHSYWTPGNARNWLICPPPAAWAELKSTSLSAWGMADHGVWRVGEAWSNGRESTHACMWLGSAHTVHHFTSILGHIPCASSWHLFDWPGRCETPWSGHHCSHLWSAPAAASHSGGWRASQTSAG